METYKQLYRKIGNPHFTSARTPSQRCVYQGHGKYPIDIPEPLYTGIGKYIRE